MKTKLLKKLRYIGREQVHILSIKRRVKCLTAYTVGDNNIFKIE